MIRREERIGFLAAVLVSAFLHLSGLYGMDVHKFFSAPAKAEKFQVVTWVKFPEDLPGPRAEPVRAEEPESTSSMKILPDAAETAAEEKKPAPPAETPTAAEEKPPLPVPPPAPSVSPAQVVDLGPEDPNDKTPEPESARYLAERNMRTERETVNPSQARTGSPRRPPPAYAPDQPPSLLQPAPPPSAGGNRRKPPGPDTNKKSSKTSAAEKSGGKQRKATAEGGNPAAERPEKSPPLRVADNGLARPGETTPTGESRRGEGDGGTESKAGGSGRGSGRPGSRGGLAVTMSDIGKAEDSDEGSVDYLPQAARGEVTSLNAKKFTYAEFYNRIKKVIRFYWDPEPALRTINWSGATLETRLKVVVRADGSLELVEVIASCGYPVVDAAAVTAVRKAAPFYNVPAGLLSEEGKFEDIWSFFIHL